MFFKFNVLSFYYFSPLISSSSFVFPFSKTFMLRNFVSFFLLHFAFFIFRITVH